MKILFEKDEYGSDRSELEGTSSVVQWFKILPSKAGSTGSIREPENPTCHGTEIPYAMECRTTNNTRKLEYL